MVFNCQQKEEQEEKEGTDNQPLISRAKPEAITVSAIKATQVRDAQTAENQPDNRNITTVIGDWLKWFGDNRDGFLISGAVLYGLGYFVWSINAWQNHLGQLPAIQFQYIISGIIPAFIILIAWFGVIGSGKAIRFLEKKFSISESTSWEDLMRKGSFRSFRFFMKFIPFAMLTVIGITLYFSNWKSFLWPRTSFEFCMTLLLSIISYVCSIFYSVADKTSPGDVVIPMRVNQFMFIAFFCWYSFLIYFTLYPHLPQVLGGPEPRCAYIDLVREQLAPTSVFALAPSSATDKIVTKVVRSDKLFVYFSSTDYLLVRTKPTDITKLTDIPLYELRKDTIRAVEWHECED